MDQDPVDARIGLDRPFADKCLRDDTGATAQATVGYRPSGIDDQVASQEGVAENPLDMDRLGDRRGFVPADWPSGFCNR